MSSIFDGIGDDGIEQLDENLRKWFKEKWVRFGPDGKIRGACARGSDSEGKPKCLPQSKAHSIGKKGRKYAAAKKRREDPNPERRGPAKNVATKKKTNEGIPFEQCPECRGPIVHESMLNEKQDACYHKVKARYKVWPSAYASGALVQCRKKGAKNWGNKSKANENNIFKGIVDEQQEVSVLYIDGKPSTKYARDHDAKGDLERMKAKFPNKKFELKKEVREGVIVGHDANDPDVAIIGGAGTYKLSNVKKKAQMEANELAKDIMAGKFKNSAYNVKQLANTLNTIVAAEEEMKKLYFGESKDDAGFDDYDYKASMIEDLGQQISSLAEEAYELVRGTPEEARARSYWYPHIITAVGGDHGFMGGSMYSMMDTVHALYETDQDDDDMSEDYTGEFAAEVTPAINPYGGLKDKKVRGAIGEALLSETPTDNPTGASGEGGWRRTDKPELNEAKMSDIVNPLVKQFNLENGGDGRWPLYGASGSLRRWRRGDGSYYTDPNKIISLSDNKSLQKEFFGWLTQQPGVQPAGKIRGEFASSDYADAVKYKGLIFINRGVYTEYTTPSRLRNSSVWHQKTDEDTAYAGGMGQGGNVGQSYRKFKPKSAGTFKEDTETKWEVAIEYGPTAHHTAKIKVSAPDSETAQAKALAQFKKKFPDRRGMVGDCTKINEEQLDEVSDETLLKYAEKASDARLHKKLPTKKVDNRYAGVNKALSKVANEEQLDEKCWDSHKQVGMKKKGDKMVPNCVPKESAIMKGLTGKRS